MAISVEQRSWRELIAQLKDLDFDHEDLKEYARQARIPVDVIIYVGPQELKAVLLKVAEDNAPQNLDTPVQFDVPPHKHDTHKHWNTVGIAFLALAFAVIALFMAIQAGNSVTDMQSDGIETTVPRLVPTTTVAPTTTVPVTTTTTTAKCPSNFDVNTGHKLEVRNNRCVDTVTGRPY